MPSEIKLSNKNLVFIFIISLILFIITWFYQFYFYNDDIITKLLFSKKTEGQLYTYIKLLSSFEFNNSFYEGIDGLKNIPFPLGSLIFHSIFFKIFGDIGLVVIDFFGIFFFLIVFFLIFKNNVNNSYALLYSVLLFTLPSILIHFFGENFLYLTQLTNDFYNLRVHRPFPSSLYLYGSILILLLLQKNNFKDAKLFIIFGFILGLQATGFYYFFIISSISFGLSLLLSKKTNLLVFMKKNYKDFIFLIFFFLITLIPFIFFIINSEPDIVTASGIFELSSDKKFFLIKYFVNKYFDIKFLVFNILILSIYISTNYYFKISNRMLNTILIFYISSILSPIIFFLISPKSGLIYHFTNSILLIGYIYIICFFLIIYYEITKNFTQKFFNYFLISIILILVSYFNISYNKKIKENIHADVRTEFFEITTLINNLVKSSGSNTLLTFDFSFMDWAIIKNKFENLNLVYSTATPRTFDVIENNLINTFHFLELTKDDFEEFLKNTFIDGRYYNRNVQKFMYLKYTANILNRFNNSNDFTASEFNHIIETSPLLSKQIAIPNFEMRRLINKFYITDKKQFISPSIIILTKSDNFYDNININKKKYCKIFSKKIYEVFIKKKLYDCN